MNQTFEEFLEERFAQITTVSKTDFESALDNWLADLDVQELMDYGQEFAKKCYAEGLKALNK